MNNLPSMADCKLEAALCKIANTVIDLPASNFSTIGGMCNNKNPWAQHAKSIESKIANDGPAGQTMVRYNKDGVATCMEKRMLLSKGFLPNTRVVVKESKGDAGSVIVYSHIMEN